MKTNAKGVRFIFNDEIDAAEFNHAVSHADNFISSVETKTHKRGRDGENETTYIIDVLYRCY